MGCHACWRFESKGRLLDPIRNEVFDVAEVKDKVKMRKRSDLVFICKVHATTLKTNIHLPENTGVRPAIGYPL